MISPRLFLPLLALLPFLLAEAQEEKPAPKTEVEPKFTNRLAKEKSPYLRQHAHNPVDWYPWGEEAFEKARRENKAVFLSIGYATCHWCHVMERESFEDEETAKMMDELFVCVKVDREERPDIDRIYMNFQQAMYGHGGWPLSVWLTPDRIPFGSGTYFPPKPSRGSPSFTQVCEQIQGHWEKNGDKIRADPEGTAARLQEMLSGVPAPSGNTFSASPELLVTAFQALANRFDSENGGFGGAPKFPQPDQVDFLLQYHLDTTRPENERTRALHMAAATLDAMAQGGIRDHLGGGFHRYAVDAIWHVPHFEKMLYDQAQLARSFLTLHQITGIEEPAAVAREILAYLERDMGHEGGAFHSAEDADSYESADADHKTEGAFYVWTAEEVEEVLGKEEADLFSKAYGVREEGNVSAGSDPHGELEGKSHLFRQTEDKALAKFLAVPEEEITKRLEASRAKLFAARANRIRPIRDDKVLTSWNGLAISAFAHAHRALGDEAYLERANRAADFVLENLRDKEGSLLRTWLDGPSAIPATAADYATLVAGLLDLYDASFDPARIAQAVELQDRMIALLHDPEGGGFYDATEAQTDLIIRLKHFQDGVEPSANSQAAINLMRLYQLLDRKDYAEVAEGIFQAAAPILETAPHAVLRLVEALRLDLAPPPQILVAADTLDSPEARGLLLAAQRAPHQSRVLALLAPGMKGPLGESEMLASHSATEGKPTLYLCQNFTCKLPTNDAAKIREMIAEALAK